MMALSEEEISLHCCDSDGFEKSIMYAPTFKISHMKYIKPVSYLDTPKIYCQILSTVVTKVGKTIYSLFTLCTKSGYNQWILHFCCSYESNEAWRDIEPVHWHFFVRNAYDTGTSDNIKPNLVKDDQNNILFRCLSKLKRNIIILILSDNKY